jgi:hypothetical protein
MLYTLVALTLVLTAADHWTTYLCLRAPVTGWQVTEVNPIAEWLFATVGLVPGIVLDSVITLLAVAFLVGTRFVPAPAKSAFFLVIVLWTGYAVANNLQAIQALGLSPLGSWT